MQYLEGKLAAAHVQVSGWMGSVRRSLQGALELMLGGSNGTEDGRVNVQEDEDEEEEDVVESGGGRFQRAVAPLRSFTRRSRRSLRRFSRRTHQSFSRRSQDDCPEQVRTCIEGEGLDTEALISSEPEQQDGPSEETSPAVDSPEAAPEQSAEAPLEELDAGPPEVEIEELPAFPESSTPLLDSVALRSRVELRKRRSQHTRLPRSGRQSSVLSVHTESPTPDWRACDSTDAKVETSKHSDSNSEDEEPSSAKKTAPPPPPTSQRVSVFPGFNASALMAQLKKRTGGGGGGGGEAVVEKSSTKEEEVTSPSQPPRPQRSPAHLAGAARVLPPLGGKDGGTNSSPSWLKELKKKRLSQDFDS